MPSKLHQYFKYVDDKAMVRMMFAKIQPLKKVENYFTDSLLYRENGKVIEKLLPDDIDSGNETNSKSGEDLEVSFDEEPIVAYLNNPDCNNSTDNGDEWVLKENINFNYSLCYNDANSPIDMSPLHMPANVNDMHAHRGE